MGGQDRLIGDLTGSGLRASRLLRDRPEIQDGLIWVPASRWVVVPHTGTSWTTSRSAAGDYRLSRTAAGAETHYLSMMLEGLTRRTIASGLKVTGVLVAYNVGTANATSVDLSVYRTSYADRVAVSVASFGGSLTYDANHDTAAERYDSTAGNNPHLLTATFGSAQYQELGSSAVVAELAVVLPNTCVFGLLGGGFQVAHNYI